MKKVMAKCLNCGKELTNYQKTFCSVACQDKFRAKEKREIYEENPKHCKYCGAELPYEKRMNNYCNQSCAAKFNNQNRVITEEQKEKTRNSLNARYGCDKLVYEKSDEEFIRIISTNDTWYGIMESLGYKKHAPSKSLKLGLIKRCESLNIELKIKEIPNLIKMTKGEMFDRANHWTNARIMIQRIAKRCFRNANKDRKCAVCGYDKHIDIAHIKAVADFDDSATLEEINNPDNLIGLCPNHHWEYDHGMLDLEKYLKKNN